MRKRPDARNEPEVTSESKFTSESKARGGSKPTSGRRMPPIGKRWPKGVSGNPKGRPPKKDSLTSLLKEEIAKICPADRESRTYMELLVMATLQQAMKGNATALKEVWERLDGKVPQPEVVQLSGTAGKPVNIHVTYDDQESDKPDAT